MTSTHPSADADPCVHLARDDWRAVTRSLRIAADSLKTATELAQHAARGLTGHYAPDPSLRTVLARGVADALAERDDLFELADEIDRELADDLPDSAA